MTKEQVDILHKWISRAEWALILFAFLYFGWQFFFR